MKASGGTLVASGSDAFSLPDVCGIGVETFALQLSLLLAGGRFAPAGLPPYGSVI